jgi:hypothetical protein
MPPIDQLIQGNRYMFYRHDAFAFQGKVFRANYIDVCNLSIRLSCYNCIDEDPNEGIWTMPLDWIEKVENLNEITDIGLLPEDVVICIDNFA